MQYGSMDKSNECYAGLIRKAHAGPDALQTTWATTLCYKLLVISL